jgi:hypothetical protein
MAFSLLAFLRDAKILPRAGAERSGGSTYRVVVETCVFSPAAVCAAERLILTYKSRRFFMAFSLLAFLRDAKYFPAPERNAPAEAHTELS